MFIIVHMFHNMKSYFFNKMLFLQRSIVILRWRLPMFIPIINLVFKSEYLIERFNEMSRFIEWYSQFKLIGTPDPSRQTQILAKSDREKNV